MSAPEAPPGGMPAVSAGPPGRPPASGPRRATVAFIFVLVGASGTAIQKTANLVTWLVGLGAVVFLWRSDSSAYFNAPRAGPA